MRFSSIILSVAVTCFQALVSAQDSVNATLALNSPDTVLTLDLVESQISAFLSNQSVTARSTSSSDCAIACAFLHFVLPSYTSYPDTTLYEYEEERYWSVQQSSTTPTCRYSPASALEVSLAVLTFRTTQCQFAVKSGGHAAFQGSSNIEDGVTIDFLNMKDIVVSEDKTQTSIQPGNTWYEVYTELEPRNLSVVGGRVSAIGVGGLTLGGGISFFSGRYGWACDNVNTFEVVFADGTIRDVSESTYPDLYWALRGGGNNFGIVTRFDLVTFSQGDLWAGSNTYLISEEAALNQAFEDFNINAPSDPYAQLILAYAYVQSYDMFVIAGDYQYGKPVADPPILQNFTAVPSIASTLRITNLTSLTAEFNASNPGGYRETYWALMVKNSASLISDMVAIYMDEIAAVKNATGIVPAIVFQPIATDMTSQFTKNGGNCLGITEEDGPLNLINISISWSDEADDAAIMQAARNIVNRSNATAYDQGLGNPYIYQNYAALEQPVFTSYGAANYAKLLTVSKKYDPNGVWEQLQPGYFKL